jgi:hypothetical protein
MKRLVATALLAVSGCASQDMVWTGGSGSTEQFNRDDYACRRDAVGLGGAAYVPFAGAVVAAPQPDMGMYRLCMKAAGYTLRS